MNTLVSFWRWLRSLGRSRVMKHEIDEELRLHLELRTAENIAAGMSAEDAARAARRRFGNLQSVREECRDTRGTSFGEATWQDVSFGLRMLCKNPGFTTVAVLTLALGIGANTAVCSIVNAVILRPLPYKDSSRMVTFEMKAAAFPNLSLYLSWPAFQAIRDNADSLEQIVACWEIGRTQTGTQQPAVLNVAGVSAGFFEEMSARAQAGRLLSDQDQKPAQNH